MDYKIGAEENDTSTLVNDGFQIKPEKSSRTRNRKNTSSIGS
ncbi:MULTISPECIES: hypothetical protein [Peribacillus]